jgi:hypothetical protein
LRSLAKLDLEASTSHTSPVLIRSRDRGTKRNKRRIPIEAMRMTLASTFRRLAFAPLPAPPGLFALPLRLIVGYGFLEHGYAKLARGPDDFIAILHAIGMPFAFFSRLGDDPYRGDRRIADPIRGFRAARLRAHDRRAARRDRHRPSSEWIQLDQADRLRRVGRAFWTARL